MSIVINEGNQKRYTINHYSLKVIQAEVVDDVVLQKGISKHALRDFDTPEPVTIQEEELSQEENEEEEEASVDQSELIESLLKKADDFSSKYVKAQMDYEQVVEERDATIETAKKSAYDEGYEAAKAEFLQNQEASNSAIAEQMQASIQQLDNEGKDFTAALERIQEELVGAALDIAKEVIQQEVSKAPQEIALSLAKALMVEIDKASAITIRVNPAQLDFFQKALGESEKISIVSDRAIVEGGVVLVSNMGTIEADIMKRYEQVKKAALVK